MMKVGGDTPAYSPNDVPAYSPSGPNFQPASSPQLESTEAPQYTPREPQSPQSQQSQQSQQSPPPAMADGSKKRALESATPTEDPTETVRTFIANIRTDLRVARTALRAANAELVESRRDNDRLRAAVEDGNRLRTALAAAMHGSLQQCSICNEMLLDVLGRPCVGAGHCVNQLCTECYVSRKGSAGTCTICRAAALQ